MKRTYLLVFLFILGLVFRFWLINLVPQPFAHDQLQYHNYARGIVEKGLFAHTFRLYGYPMLIAPVYFLFGSDNATAWKIFQIIMDTSTAVLVFLMAKHLFINKRVAYISYLLYLFNPFTSAYAGVLLTEVASIFFTALMIYFFILFIKQRKLKYLVLLVFTMGYLTQVRSTFFFYTLLLLVAVIYILRHLQPAVGKWLQLSLLTIFIYFLPYIYTISGNAVIYKQFSLLTVDDFFIQNMYLSLYVDRWPYHPNENTLFPRQVGQVFGEFSFGVKNAEERKALSKKYWDLSWTELTGKPVYYISRALTKCWYIWEKHTLFYYQELSNQPVLTWLYWVNLASLFSGLAGFLSWILSKKMSFEQRIFGIFSISLIAYLTVIHIFSVSEERFSLPAYPLVFLFMGYLSYKIVCYLRLHYFSK